MPVLINPYAFGVVSNDHILTAGAGAGAVGFSSGGYLGIIIGAFTPVPESHGFSVVSAYDFVYNLGIYGTISGAVFELAGNHTGAQFTSVVAHGVTNTRAAAAVVAGTYNSSSDSTFWSWSTLWGFAAGNMYTVTINP